MVARVSERETGRMEDARGNKGRGWHSIYIKNGLSASLGSDGLSQAAIALQRLG